MLSGEKKKHDVFFSISCMQSTHIIIYAKEREALKVKAESSPVRVIIIAAVNLWC